MKLKLLCKLEVAGIGHHEWKDNLDEVPTESVLKSDVDNKYDPRAVMVLAGDKKLGYAPRNWNQVFRGLLDAGYPLQARLEKDLPHCILMGIYIEDKTAE